MIWQVAPETTFDLNHRAVIMGIVNVTPDSFSDGGRFPDVAAAVAYGVAQWQAGAEILDIGGESTRPGAAAVGAQEEMDLVLPVFAGLRQAVPDARLSIDTMKAEVATAALAAGAVIINDVTGFTQPAMINPLFPALRSGPSAVSGAFFQKQIPSSRKFMNAISSLCILFAAMLGAACESTTANLRRQTAEISKDPVVAEAGWKVGQVYKTVKRGGVTLYGRKFYCLEDEADDPRVKKAWQIPNYRDEWFAYKVEAGELFQVTAFEYGGLNNYFVFGVHLPNNPLDAPIQLDNFGTEETIRGSRRWLDVRNPKFLVPAAMPTASSAKH